MIADGPNRCFDLCQRAACDVQSTTLASGRKLFLEKGCCLSQGSDLRPDDVQGVLHQESTTLFVSQTRSARLYEHLEF